ncbi:Transposase Tc1-like [Trinorchestia longiramus]|nr:Transposase Tc1-like [Trinorchestia longiramus]
MGDSFRAREISIRAQKKLLSKMSTKNVAKTFIDDTSASVLDNTYNLAKAYVSIGSYWIILCFVFLVVHSPQTTREELQDDLKASGIEASKHTISRALRRKVLRSCTPRRTPLLETSFQGQAEVCQRPFEQASSVLQLSTVTGNKKEAEKIVKNIIKIIVKIGILARNDQFTTDDMRSANQLRTKFSTIVKTVISFYEVDFTFDKAFLAKNINDCRDLLKRLVKEHLTDKSIGRIDHVLDFFSDGDFLEEMFRKDSVYRPQLKVIIEDLNKAMDEGEL